MSYTKLEKEIEKYYKQNNLTFYHNTLTETKEEQELRLKKYNEVRDLIVKKWIEEKKYPELISCAHGGWFKYEEFEKPLEDYFVKENLISYLKFLCERKIRFRIEDMLSSLKHLEEDVPKISKERIINYTIETIDDASKYHSFESSVKYRIKSLNLLDKYIALLKNTTETSYINTIETIREKVNNLSIKKSDLNAIKFKI